MKRAPLALVLIALVVILALTIDFRGLPSRITSARVRAAPSVPRQTPDLTHTEPAPLPSRPAAKVVRSEAVDPPAVREAGEVEVVVSHGTVEEIGRQAGFILPSLGEMKALAANPSLTPEEKSRLLDLQRRYADVLGVLPEIAGFQNNPAEYGSFFRSMVRQSAGLGDAQAAQVESYMRQRAQEMIAAQLNEANMPAAGQQAWEDRRDVFNEQTVSGLRQLLTPPVADKAGVTPQLLEFLETDFDKAGTQPLP